MAELSGNLGADAVFDTAGGAGPLEAALAVSRPGGAVVLFAHAARRPARRAGFDLNAFFKAERRLLASYSSSLADQREVYRLLVSRRLDPSPLVTHRLPLSRFQEAVALTRERRALKVLLVPDGEAGWSGSPLLSSPRSDRSPVERPVTQTTAFLIGPERLEMREVPVPVPGAGELLLRVGAATTCGTDLKVFQRGGHPRMLKAPDPVRARDGGHHHCRGTGSRALAAGGPRGGGQLRAVRRLRVVLARAGEPLLAASST